MILKDSSQGLIAGVFILLFILVILGFLAPLMYIGVLNSIISGLNCNNIDSLNNFSNVIITLGIIFVLIFLGIVVILLIYTGIKNFKFWISLSLFLIFFGVSFELVSKSNEFYGKKKQELNCTPPPTTSPATTVPTSSAALLKLN